MGKRDSRNCIKSKYPCKPSNIFRMLRIINPASYSSWNWQNQYQENHWWNNKRYHTCTEHFFLLSFIFIESEKCGLHAVCQDNHKEWGIGIKHAYCPIIRRVKHISVKRYQQIGKDTAQNTGNSINGSLAGQAFDRSHEDKGRKKERKVVKFRSSFPEYQ